MIGLLAIIAVIGMSIAAGLHQFTFWWVLIPTVVASSISLHSALGEGPHSAANINNRVGALASIAIIRVAVVLAVAGAIYSFTSIVSTLLPF